MLNHINHKMPVYKECTLIEVMVTAISSFLILVFGLSIVSKVLLGYFWPGYLLASVFFIFVTKYLLSKLQKLKYGKPHGYYQHFILNKLAKYGLIRSKYLTRIGKWSVRRIINEKH